jgi:predicted RNase H-like HicB family nuclease/predicted RNA binding protein YcfA (HicA-like mRNA interferase family)
VKVRKLISLLERDGWRLDRQSGSHRQYRHPLKAGTVTVSGNLGKRPASGRLEGTLIMSGYAVIIEGDGTSYSGYAPDLPGCIATGSSPDEVEQLMREAIRLHIESLRAHGEAVPRPSAAAATVVPAV